MRCRASLSGQTVAGQALEAGSKLLHSPADFMEALADKSVSLGWRKAGPWLLLIEAGQWSYITPASSTPQGLSTLMLQPQQPLETQPRLHVDVLETMVGGTIPDIPHHAEPLGRTHDLLARGGGCASKGCYHWYVATTFI